MDPGQLFGPTFEPALGRFTMAKILHIRTWAPFFVMSDVQMNEQTSFCVAGVCISACIVRTALRFNPAFSSMTMKNGVGHLPSFRAPEGGTLIWTRDTYRDRVTYLGGFGSA